MQTSFAIRRVETPNGWSVGWNASEEIELIKKNIYNFKKLKSRSQIIAKTKNLYISSRLIHTNPDQAIIDLSLNQDVAHA